VSNLEALGGAAAGEVLASQTTASVTYVDLATSGPAVSVDTGTTAVALIQAQVGLSTAGAILMAVAVSGATTRAAADDNALYVADAYNNQSALAALLYFSGLTPGTNIFTVKYRVTAGTATFIRRRILVIPIF
jgi:hypothetical protein